LGEHLWVAMRGSASDDGMLARFGLLVWPETGRTGQALVTLAVLFAAPVALGGSAVYRCTEGGRTVFSDSPCPGCAPVAGGAPANLSGNYSTLLGDWRGQAQYQASKNGQRVEAAHSVVPLVLSVGGDGKVIGISATNGCKFLGVSAPGLVAAVLDLDVSLTNCNYPGMNRRFSGSLLLNASAKTAQLSLQAYSSPAITPASFYDIKATLRR
jgi:hypothetical protein